MSLEWKKIILLDVANYKQLLTLSNAFPENLQRGQGRGCKELDSAVLDCSV